MKRKWNQALAAAACAALLCCLSGCGGGGQIRQSANSFIANASAGGVTGQQPLRIVYRFQREGEANTELHTMLTDGTGDAMLDSAVLIGDLWASEKLSSVYYVRGEAMFPFTSWDLYSADTATGAVTRRTSSEFVEYQARVLDNGSVYFSQNRDQGNDIWQGDVFRLKADGETQITNNSTFGVWFDISQTEDYIFYLDGVTYTKNLYRYDIATGHETLLATETNKNISVRLALSPDSAKLAFLTGCSSASSSSCSNFNVIDAQTGQALIEKTSGMYSLGAWAPDSARIAISEVVLDSGEFRQAVSVYTVATGQKQILTDLPADALFVVTDWSADGTLITGWNGKRDAESTDIFIARPDGSGYKTLTQHANGDYAADALFVK